MQKLGDSLNFIIGTFLLFGLIVSIGTTVYYGYEMLPQWILKIVCGLIIGSFLYDYFTGFKVNHYFAYTLTIFFYVCALSALSLIENTNYEPYFKEVAKLNSFNLTNYFSEKISVNEMNFDWLVPLVVLAMLLIVGMNLPLKIVQHFINIKKKQAV